MSLLEALLMLEKQAEGRRLAMRELLYSVGKVVEEMLRELRVGDSVECGGNRFEVELREVGGRPTKVLTMNSGVLGPRGPQDTYASLEDNQRFAAHVREVIDAFAEKLNHDKRKLLMERP